MLIKDRVYTLTLGNAQTGKGRRITDLNISFSVKNSSESAKKTNKALISIWNLDKQTLEFLEDEEYLTVFLDVGYVGTGTDNILIGNVLSVKTEKKGTDRITQIQLAESYTSLYFTKLSEIVPESEEATVEDVIRTVVARMGNINNAEYSGSGVKIPVKDGYPLLGSPKQVLDNIAKTYRLSYTIQQQTLRVTDEGKPFNTNKDDAFVLNENTGLINIPFREIKSEGKRSGDKTKAKGVSFKALLNPFIRAGDIVKLESESISGFFKVKDIEYSGEYRGNKWFIDCYCEDLALLEE